MQQSADPKTQRHPVTDRTFKVGPTFGDKDKAGIGGASGLTRDGPQGRLGNLNLGQRRPTRQPFNRRAIQVAAGEIHLAIAGNAAQAGFDLTGRLEQIRPVDVGNQPHAGDDIAHRDVRGTLTFLGMKNHKVWRAVLPRQPLFQPAKCWRGARVQVAQSFGQLGSQHLGHRDIGRRIGLGQRTRRVRAQYGIRHDISLGAFKPPKGHLIDQTAQVLDQNDAQRDRHRPQLANSQRLHGLIGHQIAAQGFGVEMAVGMGDIGPDQPEKTRVSGKGAIGQFWELAVVASGQVVADLAHLRLDQMVIVQKPFGGRHHVAPRSQFRRRSAVGCQQNLGVPGQTVLQRQHKRWAPGNGLGFRKTCGVALQPFDAEQFGTGRRGISPCRRRIAYAKQGLQQRHR